MLNLTIENAELANMNTRTEREGEERRRGAVDLKIKVTLPVDDAAKLCGPDPNTRAWLRALWDGENINVGGVGPITGRRDWENLQITVEPDTLDMFDDSKNIELKRAKLNKVLMEPQFSQMMDVEFRIQCHPNPEDVGDLYLQQGSTVQLSIQQQSVADSGASQAEDQMAGTEEEAEA